MPEQSTRTDMERPRWGETPILRQVQPTWGDPAWGDPAWGDPGRGDSGWGDPGWGDSGWGDSGWGDLQPQVAEAEAKAVADLHMTRYWQIRTSRTSFTPSNPDHRHTLARHLWHRTRQEYWWLIQIIVPITRLPPELLQQILLIIIDEASDSPLVLMLVCKHWYTIVTGIWASLNLGTTTPKDAVTAKLERNQWLLDVLVDTEIDRGDFTPSEGAYEAIFAAIEATSRWRSLRS
jgi:hypothetical protein